MLKIYSSVLGEELKVSQEGTFELPSRTYNSSDLKKIAREVNRAIRDINRDELVNSYEE